ncbi:MAG: GntR family transcriptional regulator [Deltaproteobacteria bacterium]|nr:GntR family transcriptional regulator [Deltaproteobacteria bacterium]
MSKKIEPAPPLDSEKKSPAYRALAQAIRDKIVLGEYALGAKIPSEATISRDWRVSTMTVRQAVGLLVQSGILERIQGSGTYVVAQTWPQANFGWTHLAELLADRDNITLTIFKACLVSAGPKTAAYLGLSPNSQVIYLDRLIQHKGQPILLNHSILRFDPRSPIVEAEQELIALTRPSQGLAQKHIKKHLLRLTPVVLSAQQAQRLGLLEGEPTLKINYTFFDFNDNPLGSGWFLAPRKLTILSARLGFWVEEDS